MFMNLFASLQVPYGNVMVLGNSVRGFVIALLVFLVSLLIFALVQYLLVRHFSRLVKKTATDFDDMLLRLFQNIRPPFYTFIALYLAIRSLAIPALVDKIIAGVFLVWVVYEVIKIVQVVFEYMFEKAANRREDASSKAAFLYIARILKWMLWIVAALFVLANLGVNVTSALAGLGIGGIAIALAAQNVLGDLFSSFAIFFDQPFQPGDFISLGEHKGTVEKIGIKTTRLRALSGEELIIPNKQLTGAQVQNYKRMEKRRADFSFGILYETPVEKVRRAKEIVQEIFEGLEGVELSRVHFSRLGDSALEFDVVFNLDRPAYGFYMDTQEKINLALMEKLALEGIEFAYPTQTLYLKKENLSS